MLELLNNNCYIIFQVFREVVENAITLKRIMFVIPLNYSDDINLHRDGAFVL